MKIKIDFISIIEKWGRHLIPCSYGAPYTKISYNSPQLPVELPLVKCCLWIPF